MNPTSSDSELYSDEVKVNFTPKSFQLLKNFADGIPNQYGSKEQAEQTINAASQHMFILIVSTGLTCHSFIKGRLPIGDIARQQYEKQLSTPRFIYRKSAPFVFGFISLALARQLINNVIPNDSPILKWFD